MLEHLQLLLLGSSDARIRARVYRKMSILYFRKLLFLFSASFKEVLTCPLKKSTVPERRFRCVQGRCFFCFLVEAKQVAYFSLVRTLEIVPTVEIGEFDAVALCNAMH